MAGTYDYIIVGAGSAGCVLASRLTEDPGTRVLLLEAGGNDTHPFIRIPLGVGKLHQHRMFDWGYNTVPEAGMAGREPRDAARQSPWRLVVDQHDRVHARQSRGLRPLGAERRNRLVVERGAAVLQTCRDLAGRRNGVARWFRASPRRCGEGGRSAHGCGRQGCCCRRLPADRRLQCGGRRRIRADPVQPAQRPARFGLTSVLARRPKTPQSHRAHPRHRPSGVARAGTRARMASNTHAVALRQKPRPNAKCC